MITNAERSQFITQNVHS